MADDVLEIINKDGVEDLTNHLNQIDPTKSIKFTYDQEEQGQIPFLDTLIVRKEDGSVKLLVYREKSHTDQYLNFTSHHPLHQKLGVVRTLLDRKDKIVTEEKDREQEENKIKTALNNCGYPDWTIEKVKDQMEKKPTNKKPTKKHNNTDTPKKRNLAVIPYVQGLSERIQRIYKKYDITTAMKPHTTLRRLLVHPKDKREVVDTANCVYEIPCSGCKSTYIGETGRQFGIRLSEHKKDVDRACSRKYTRSERKVSESEQNKSAVADHAARSNHLINWEESRVIDKEEDLYNKFVFWSMEVIYTDATSRIHLDIDVSEIVTISRGVRQGDTLSPKIFTAAMEALFKKTTFG
ncbi:uncharacterized protein [Amphiura filiformis]|uniref:uncharacterized protein n=1 Tax=Amphiura filiformis TaxID=82378 RepID=UPI003B217E19